MALVCVRVWLCVCVCVSCLAQLPQHLLHMRCAQSAPGLFCLHPAHMRSRKFFSACKNREDERGRGCLFVSFVFLFACVCVRACVRCVCSCVCVPPALHSSPQHLLHMRCAQSAPGLFCMHPAHMPSRKFFSACFRVREGYKKGKYFVGCKGRA